MALFNFAIAGAVCSKEKRYQLYVIPIAVCRMSKEKEENYTRALEQFKKIVWVPVSCALPSVFVTDNDSIPWITKVALLYSRIATVRAVVIESESIEEYNFRRNEYVRTATNTCGYKAEDVVAYLEKMEDDKKIQN
ncbi:hypothetical protein [Parasitella parasitica]|uniref:Uncharacterized protein n=1 Tax=Parasitella parasitica TaxID=35722 RepID=A0A0B7N7L8_9FUNG|nr:hypothetical protein [Parasitella parasitica]